jgi:hypothetical protein
MPHPTHIKYMSVAFMDGVYHRVRMLRTTMDGKFWRPLQKFICGIFVRVTAIYSRDPGGPLGKLPCPIQKLTR